MADQYALILMSVQDRLFHDMSNDLYKSFVYNLLLNTFQFCVLRMQELNEYLINSGFLA